MARPRTLSEAAAEKAAEAEAMEAAPEEPVKAPTLKEAARFPLEVLRKDCMKLYHVTTSTFDGATSGMTGERTINEVRDVISAWGKKEVACE